MKTQKQLQESAIRKIERIISEQSGVRDLNIAKTNIKNVDVGLLKLRTLFQDDLARKTEIENIIDLVSELRKSIDREWMSNRR